MITSWNLLENIGLDGWIRIFGNFGNHQFLPNWSRIIVFLQFFLRNDYFLPKFLSFLSNFQNSSQCGVVGCVFDNTSVVWFWYHTRLLHSLPSTYIILANLKCKDLIILISFSMWNHLASQSFIMKYPSCSALYLRS